MYRTLTPEGRPIRPHSFFFGIRKEFVKPVDFVELMTAGRPFNFPIRFVGRLENLSGTIQQLRLFPEGMLVIGKPLPGSLLENWAHFELWIEVKDKEIVRAGVLN